MEATKRGRCEMVTGKEEMKIKCKDFVYWLTD